MIFLREDKYCDKKYCNKVNKILLENNWIVDNKEYQDLLMKCNKCKTKDFIFVLIFFLFFPIIVEWFFYFKNWKLDLNLFFIVWKFSLLFFWFFFIWYFVIIILKYKNWTYLLWFIFAIFIYLLWFFIYFNFNSFIIW